MKSVVVRAIFIAAVTDTATTTTTINGVIKKTLDLNGIHMKRVRFTVYILMLSVDNFKQNNDKMRTHVA